MRIATTEYADNGVATLAFGGHTITGNPLPGSAKYLWVLEDGEGVQTPLPMWAEPRMWLWAQGYFFGVGMTIKIIEEAAAAAAEEIAE